MFNKQSIILWIKKEIILLKAGHSNLYYLLPILLWVIAGVYLSPGLWGHDMTFDFLKGKYHIGHYPRRPYFSYFMGVFFQNPHGFFAFFWTLIFASRFLLFHSLFRKKAWIGVLLCLSLFVRMSVFTGLDNQMPVFYLFSLGVLFRYLFRSQNIKLLYLSLFLLLVTALSRYNALSLVFFTALWVLFLIKRHYKIKVKPFLFIFLNAIYIVSTYIFFNIFVNFFIPTGRFIHVLDNTPLVFSKIIDAINMSYMDPKIYDRFKSQMLKTKEVKGLTKDEIFVGIHNNFNKQSPMKASLYLLGKTYEYFHRIDPWLWLKIISSNIPLYLKYRFQCFFLNVLGQNPQRSTNWTPSHSRHGIETLNISVKGKRPLFVYDKENFHLFDYKKNKILHRWIGNLNNQSLGFELIFYFAMVCFFIALIFYKKYKKMSFGLKDVALILIFISFLSYVIPLIFLTASPEIRFYFSVYPINFVACLLLFSLVLDLKKSAKIVLNEEKTVPIIQE